MDQLNMAVAQMDTVTQSNAASSEEAASSSEELAAQASELSSIVERLARVAGVDTSRSNGRPGPVRQDTNPARPKNALVRSGRATGNGKELARSEVTRTVAASEVIPLDDDDLSDF